MTKKRKITFILNPKSGTTSKAEVPALIGQIIDKDLFDTEICFTEYAGHAAEIAQQERNNNSRPEIKDPLTNISQYNTILLGDWDGIIYELEYSHTITSSSSNEFLYKVRAKNVIG